MRGKKAKRLRKLGLRPIAVRQRRPDRFVRTGWARTSWEKQQPDPDAERRAEEKRARRRARNVRWYRL